MRLLLSAFLALSLAISVAPQISFAGDGKDGGPSDSGGETGGSSGGSSGGNSGASSGGSSGSERSSAGRSSDRGSNSDRSSGNDGGDNPPPKRSKTSTWCSKYELWDDNKGRCVRADAEGVTDDQRFLAVRELAYHSDPDTAWKMLTMMTEGETTRYMTYKGFLLRRNGHIEESIATYERAIELDPANIAARSYYGQLLVMMDEIELAKAQLAEIRAHGGDGTWSERSLFKAIGMGVTYFY